MELLRGMGGALNQNYQPLPDAQFPEQQGPYDMQALYDFIQQMTSVNPAEEAAMAAIPFGGIGKRLGRVAQGIRRSPADEAMQYMGRAKQAGGGGAAAFGPDLPLPNRGPTPGGPGGLQGAEMASGHPTLQPAMPANDFAGIQPLDVPSGPAPNPYQMQQGPNPYAAQQAGAQSRIGYMDDMGLPGSPAADDAMAAFPQGTPPITGDPQLDQQITAVAEQFMAQGASPDQAIEAAIMQFSDLIR